MANMRIPFTIKPDTDLGALLYYNDLKAVIDEARLVIYDSLKSNVSLKSWNYMHHEISNTE